MNGNQSESDVDDDDDDLVFYVSFNSILSHTEIIE